MDIETKDILDNLTDGLLVFNSQSELSSINFSAQKMFNVKEEEVLGKNIEDFSDFDLINNVFYLLGKDIKECFRKELEIREDLVIEITSRPVLKNENKIGSLVILHDITREKRVESMKTEFVTISAHQLRTPLSSIQWTLERVLSKKAGQLTPEQETLLKKAFEDNKRMVSLISDLLNLVKIEEGKDVYNFRKASLEKVVQSVLEYYKHEIKEKEIKFEYKVLNRRMPKIEIDPDKIKFVIQNLVDNAIKYTLPGGIIKIILSVKGEDIEFSIQDTGIGVPKAQQQSIFKKFFRASNAVKIVPDGNGTGLSVAKKIVEDHKGKIWFESQEGKGTIFYFTLPIHEKENSNN